jgi:glucose/arabinose dehydrogenase
MRLRSLLILTMAGLLAACNLSLPDDEASDPAANLTQIQLPDGFQIAVFADQLPEARSLERSPAGTIYVGTRSTGTVYALRDTTGNHRADVMHVIAEGLTMPNGVTWHQGSLYVAEVARILRFDNIEARLNDPPTPVVVADNLPDEEHHGWKFIDVGPDGKLYVPVGAPCNICDPEPPFASILRMNLDGTERETVARGVRNTVGFAWHPETQALWFTDNGRDWMGDDVPPCELNRVTAMGQHFGYPHVHGAGILDPEFGSGTDPADYRAPVQELGPHVAPLGMEFITSGSFPEAYRGDVLIAEHGSWNRSTKIGYRITRVRLNDAHEPVAYEPFATGWLQGDSNWGRPVDLEWMPDGSLLMSDDQSGVVYRIRYGADT